MGDGAVGKPTDRLRVQDFRKLRVWRHAHDLAVEIRRVTRTFPRTGHASLYSQITRAAESIPFNIAEGCGTNSQRELARFLDISIKSTLELEAQLELVRDYGILGAEDWKVRSAQVIDVRRMLCGLRSKVIASTLSDARNDATPPHGSRKTERKTP